MLLSPSEPLISLDHVRKSFKDGQVRAVEDISFVKSTEEKDRVNHLGKFEFQIKLNGATKSVRRTIQVQAQG